MESLEAEIENAEKLVAQKTLELMEAEEELESKKLKHSLYQNKIKDSLEEIIVQNHNGFNVMVFKDQDNNLYHSINSALANSPVGVLDSKGNVIWN